MWHSFKDWLIRLLGGAREEVVEEILSESADINRALEDEISWLRTKLDRSEDKYQELQTILFKRFGIVSEQGPEAVQATKQVPINTRSEGWISKRKRLEKEDFERHVQSVEDLWKGKTEKVIPPNESTGTV